MAGKQQAIATGRRADRFGHRFHAVEHHGDALGGQAALHQLIGHAAADRHHQAGPLHVLRQPEAAAPVGTAAVGVMQRREVVAGDHLGQLGQGPEPIGVGGIDPLGELAGQQTAHGHGVLHQGLGLQAAHPGGALLTGELRAAAQLALAGGAEPQLGRQRPLGPGGQQALHVAAQARGLRPVRQQVEQQGRGAHPAKASCRRCNHTARANCSR